MFVPKGISADNTASCLRSMKHWALLLDETSDILKYLMITFLSRLPSFATLLVEGEHGALLDFVMSFVRDMVALGASPFETCDHLAAAVQYQNGFAVACVVHAFLDPKNPGASSLSGLIALLDILNSQFHLGLHALLDHLLNHMFYSLSCTITARNLVGPDNIMSDILLWI